MQKTIGEALIHKLEQAGVQLVFGIPGVHNLELYRGLKRSGIRHVAARHEQGLGFMADGYARVSGRFGVCFTITGPGLTNIASAMGQALADSIPLLVVSSENRREELGSHRGFLHESPSQWSIGKTLSRFSAQLTDPAEFDVLWAQVLQHLTQGRLGPVYLEIPRDVLALPYEPLLQRIEINSPSRGPAVAAAQVQAVVERVAQAKRPLLLLGGGAISAAKAVVTVAERLNLPCVMTVNARGLVPAGHPLEIPVSPSLRSIRSLVAKADVVLAVGTEFGPTDYDMYSVSEFQKPQYLIRVDIDELQLERNLVADESYLADANEFITAVQANLPATIPVRESWLDEVKNSLIQAWDELNAPQQAQVKFLNALREALPEVTIIGDSTQPVYSGNLYFSAKAPKRWFNSSTGYGTLGYALPATNGACLADPDKPMVCLTGDGGLQFTLSELAVTRDERIRPIVMVWNNHSFKEIRHSMIAVGIEPEGVDVTPPNLEYIAKAYSLEYWVINSLDSLHKLATSYQNQRRPILVEVNPGDFE